MTTQKLSAKFEGPNKFQILKSKTLLRLVLLVFSIYLELSILNLGFGRVAAQSSTDSAIRQAVKDQVVAIKTSVAKRAFVGPISAKSEASITITNLANLTRTAVVAGDATIKLTGGKEGTFADLKVSDFVIAMGDVDSQGTLAAKRLLVIAKPAADKRLVLSGRITDTSSSSFTLETAAKGTWTVKTTKLKDLKVGDRAAVVGTSSTAFNLTAKLIVPIL